MMRVPMGTPSFCASFSSVRCVFTGRKPMLLPLSRPAWAIAKALPAGQLSSAGKSAGRSGYLVFALTVCRSPSLTRLRQSDLPTGWLSARMDERLSGLRAHSGAVLSCFGGIDRRAQANVPNLLRTDTPNAILLAVLRSPVGSTDAGFWRPRH